MRTRQLKPVQLGIGDDAAILAGGNEDFVVTTDSMMEGTHFLSESVTWQQIGRKLVAANLSDLAAMAASPTAVFLSLCIPQKAEDAADVIASEIFEGVCQASEKYDVAVAGGDTNCWNGPLVVHMTAVGQTVGRRAWRRDGAQPNDLIVVTGALGGSILGKHLDFAPRQDLVEQLRDEPGIHAAIDISDGLSLDLLRVCDASRCGAILNLDEIPISAAARRFAGMSNRPPIEHALGDGEDFELLFAIEPNAFAQVVDRVGVPNAICCGTFTSRTGLWARDGGRLRQLPATGYVHG